MRRFPGGAGGTDDICVTVTVFPATVICAVREGIPVLATAE
jgi:hypothetical protein